MKSICLILINILFYISLSIAQKETNNWCISDRYNLSFNSNPPTLTQNTAMYAFKHNASISDADGNLLFYTDGIKVWNRKHEVMPNGSDITAESSITYDYIVGSKIMVIPSLVDSNIYYLLILNGYFTNSQYIKSILKFVSIDISKEQGYGDVVIKSQTISDSIDNYSVLINQYNNESWIIARKNDGSLTQFSINQYGSISDIVDFHTDKQGFFMRITSDGSKICFCYEEKLVIYEINHKDKTLGKQVYLFDKIPYYPTAIEFSPDGSKLYVCLYNYGYIQFDISKPDNLDFVTLLQEKQHLNNSLQNGPDGKLYLIKSDYLYVIEKPNEAGLACLLKKTDYNLEDVNINLPEFPSYFLNFYAEINIQTESHCHKQITNFTPSDTAGIKSILWHFGDGNSSTEQSPIHTYVQAGDYEIKLIAIYNNRTDTITKNISIYPLPDVNLGNDTTICEGSQITIIAKASENVSYLWQNNSTANSLTTDKAGTFGLTVTNIANCTATDNIKVNISQLPNVSLSNDTTICEGSEITIFAETSQNISYQWQNNSTEKTQTTNKAGIYSLTITNTANCTATDSIKITTQPLPTIELISDTTVCKGTTITLSAGDDYESYNWSNGNIGAINELRINEPQTHTIEIFDGLCYATDSIRIYTKDCTKTVQMPNIFTPNGQYNNEFVLPDEIVGAIDLKIYNRWGMEVFHSTDINKSWNGKYKNHDCISGTYFYFLTISTENGKEIKSGHLSLFR